MVWSLCRAAPISLAHGDSPSPSPSRALGRRFHALTRTHATSTLLLHTRSPSPSPSLALSIRLCFLLSLLHSSAPRPRRSSALVVFAFSTLVDPLRLPSLSPPCLAHSSPFMNAFPPTNGRVPGANGGPVPVPAGSHRGPTNGHGSRGGAPFEGPRSPPNKNSEFLLGRWQLSHRFMSATLTFALRRHRTCSVQVLQAGRLSSWQGLSLHAFDRTHHRHGTLQILPEGRSSPKERQPRTVTDPRYLYLRTALDSDTLPVSHAAFSAKTNAIFLGKLQIRCKMRSSSHSAQRCPCQSTELRRRRPWRRFTQLRWSSPSQRRWPSARHVVALHAGADGRSSRTGLSVCSPRRCVRSSAIPVRYGPDHRYHLFVPSKLKLRVTTYRKPTGCFSNTEEGSQRVGCSFTQLFR